MSTSVAVYKEQNRKLNEKLETEILGDADKQAIIDQINENNRISEELSRKEKTLMPVATAKVGKNAKKSLKKTYRLQDNKFYL